MLAKEDALFQKVSDALYLISENRELAEKEAELEQLRAQLRKYEEPEA